MMTHTPQVIALRHEPAHAPRPPRPSQRALASRLASRLALYVAPSLALCLTLGCQQPLCPDGATAYGKVGMEVVCYQGERLKHGKHVKWFPLKKRKGAPKPNEEPTTPQLSFERMYQNNLLHGTYREWYSNGQMKTQATYRNGQLDGSYLRWYSNGQPQITARYRDNIRVGPFVEYYKNGKPKASYNYSEYGWLEGAQTHYRYNGFKMRQETYVSGKMVGRKYWRHDGTPDPVIFLQ